MIVVVIARVEEVVQFTVVTFSGDRVTGNHSNDFRVCCIILRCERTGCCTIHTVPTGGSWLPRVIVDASRIGGVVTITLINIFVVAVGSFAICGRITCRAGQPEVEVTQNDVEGEIEQTRIVIADSTVSRIFIAPAFRKRRQIVDEIFTNGLKVILWIVLFGILLAQNRFCHKRNLVVVEHQLEVCPGTNGLDSSIFPHEEILVTVIFHSRVNIRDEIITVVDDSVIVTGNIIAVIITNIEGCHVTQITIGIVGEIYQVATYLSE